MSTHTNIFIEWDKYSNYYKNLFICTFVYCLLCEDAGTDSSGRLVNVDDYITALPHDGPICYVFGAIAHNSVS
jgi:hypothetical protein